MKPSCNWILKDINLSGLEKTIPWPSMFFNNIKQEDRKCNQAPIPEQSIADDSHADCVKSTDSSKTSALTHEYMDDLQRKTKLESPMKPLLSCSHHF